MMLKKRCGTALVSALVFVVSSTFWTDKASAQAYPSKPIHLIVPFPPGGATDVLARMLAERLPAQLGQPAGQPAVVENRPGVNQLIGLQQTARAAPDGHTAVIAASGFSMLPYLVKTLPFDIQKDFAPVSLVTSGTFFLAVPASLPVKTVGEFVSYAKSRPGKINFGVAGATDMLAGEYFRNVAAFGAETIRYSGGAPALVALVAGDSHYVMLPLGPLKPQADAGKIKLLAVSSLKRDPAMPNVPTVAESGYPGFDAGYWYAVFLPGGTPRPVVDKLSEAINALIRTPEMSKRIADYKMEPIGSTADELSKLVATEVVRWGKVAKDGGIQPE